METLGGSATSVSVNRAEDEGKTNAASPKTPKRRLLDDIQGECVPVIGALQMPLSYQVTEVGHSFTILDGGKDMMFLATGSSYESSADVELDVDHSAMTPPCQGAAKKHRC
ncbi:hypothetical protein M758_UG042400 [Ceratodon purpureus]|nr:hypothetical protein M758_UG042400 [Ceratodon purpureus]